MRKHSHGAFRVSRTAFALAFLTLGSAGVAHAGCFKPDVSPPRAAPASGLIPVVFQKVHDEDERASIVGLWKFELLSKSTSTNKNPMPDGTLIDFGTAAWHDDGTELMNSGIRNPADGDFCQGVWTQVGRSTFSLNHIALAWTNGTYTGPAIIKERVTVDSRGKHFSGTFTLTQYLATVTPGHEFDQTTKLVTITGTVQATRFTAD